MGHRLNRKTPTRVAHGVAVAMILGLAAFLPHTTIAADHEIIRCLSATRALPEMSVLPDGSREARLSLGTMSITARDRIPGVFCAQECLLTLRWADGKIEKHHFSGPKILSRTDRYSTAGGRPRRNRLLYFRLRAREWIVAGVVEHRQRDGRITYEDMGTSVHLEPPEEYKDIYRGDQAWSDLKRNVAACLDRF
jgi:hypothetical protein